MVDVTPQLIKDIDAYYSKEMSKSKTAAYIKGLAKSGKVDYSHAYQYAKVVGNARAKAFKNVLNSSALPDGKMYFNIADRIVRETLPKDYEDVANVAKSAQGAINKKIGTGLKAVTPELDDDKLMGIINRLSSETIFDDVAWILEAPVKQFCASSVDDTVKANAEFQQKAGIKAVVIRTTNGKCCEWCDALAGSYTYPGVPGEVFSRHDNCTCSLEYNGEKLSAYTDSRGISRTFRR